MTLCVFELFKQKSENPAAVTRKLEAKKQDIVERIAEIKAHIENGNGTPEDGRLLSTLEQEQGALQ